MGLGTWEIVLIFLVVLLVFGAKRIPEIARGLGKGIREFKDATSSIKSELNINEDYNQRIQPPRQGTAAPRADAYQQPYDPQAEYNQQAQQRQPAPPPQPAPADNPPAPEAQPRD